MQESNKVILDENWGLFLGRLNNNASHRHYAVQINIPLFEKIIAISDNEKLNFGTFSLISSNCEHKVKSKKQFIIVLINPLEFLHDEQLMIRNISPIIQDIRNESIKYLNGELTDRNYSQLIKKLLNKLLTNKHKMIDHRIEEGLNYLKANKDRVVSLSEISRFCYLSESRFIHLFKSELGITYRRAQLWYRISQSFPTLFRKSITETAYEFGFSDSAHYSRTFKENFGFSPKEFIKNSQFIQV